MIKRTVEISTHESFVHLEHSQLIIEKDGEKLGSVPIEDLGVLILDSHRLTFSSSLMASLAENNVAIIFTDEKHLPSSLTIPFSAHTSQTKTLRKQVEASTPIKKQLWAKIISAKIRNQSRTLELCGKDGMALLEISRRIPSGDPKNLEAYAARIYWRKLFGDEFRRRRENQDTNMFLNYGYAIIRAAIARAIVGTGLHPGFGVHHKSQYNPFPLADDLVEPLRPFIDRKVYSMVKDVDEDALFELNRVTKGILLELLAEDCVLKKKKMPFLVAIGLYAASVKQVILREGKKPLFPTFAISEKDVETRTK